MSAIDWPAESRFSFHLDLAEVWLRRRDAPPSTLDAVDDVEIACGTIENYVSG
jgi:hypothetical protein